MRLRRLAVISLVCLVIAAGAAPVCAGVIVTPAAGYTITWDGTDGDYFDPANPAIAPSNLALGAGVTAFGSSQYGAGVHLIANANDGRYGNSNSWLAAGADTNPYIGLNLSGLTSVGAIAWSRDNGNNSEGPWADGQGRDRAVGTYELQYTQAASPGTGTAETGNPTTGWATVGTVQYTATPQAGFTPYLRHEYAVAATGGAPIQATGLRLKVPDEPSFGNQIAIDEIEIYSAPSSPPPIPTTGLASWLAADRGVVTDGGGNVTQWVDLSGNGHDAVPGNSPSLVANTMAGKPAVHFAGGVQHLNIHDAATLGLQNSDYEMFLVARSSSGAIQFLTAASHGAGTEHYEIHLNGSAGARFIPDNDVTNTPDRYADIGAPGAYTNGKPHVFNVRVEADTGIIRVGGMESADTVTGAQSASAQWLTLGVRGTAQYSLVGDIAEVLIYNQPLTAEQRVQVEQYLSRRWWAHYTPAGFSLAETGGSMVNLNVAAQSAGGRAFAANVLPGYASHQIDHLNDETFGNSNSWISNSVSSFAGVALDNGYLIDAIAFGRDNGGAPPERPEPYTDRFLGVYTLQYTRVPNPDEYTPDSAWFDIATLDYNGVFPDATGYLRHLYEFDPISGVTGVRILTNGAGIAIDELEVRAIPEPTTVVLVGAGLLALIRRRGSRR